MERRPTGHPVTFTLYPQRAYLNAVAIELVARDTGRDGATEGGVGAPDGSRPSPISRVRRLGTSSRG
jgi:hypothetical protein